MFKRQVWEGAPQLKRITDFLSRKSFDGFTSKDLFIKQIVKKGWGQDIAALSNMAEALTNLAIQYPQQMPKYKVLVQEVARRAMDKSVMPYNNKSLMTVKNFGKHGYYLEHMNIILGACGRCGVHDYKNINAAISRHLIDLSMGQKNFHAPLMPHVKMRWSADQAAIIYSVWLFDQNYSTELHHDLKEKWLTYMSRHMTHLETGLFETEVMRKKDYSYEPRGCAIAYLIHYMSRFAPDVAAKQWWYFNLCMSTTLAGKKGYREYLPSYRGKWTPDSGPIVFGMGIAATGLALNAATSVGDEYTAEQLKASVGGVIKFCRWIDHIPLLSKVSRIGTDLLASAIYLNAITKINWYDEISGISSELSVSFEQGRGSSHTNKNIKVLTKGAKLLC